MEDRVTLVRNLILDRIDRGGYARGEKLPGARQIATEMEFPLVTVQAGIDDLVGNGVLETISRRGTFVREDWDAHVFRHSVSVFNDGRNPMPWEGHFSGELKKILPHYRVTSQLRRSVFEIVATHYAQSHRDDYMDMEGLLDGVIDDSGDFFMSVFKPFRNADGGLVGVPMVYSPRVMFYNRELLERAGCAEPYCGWSWDEFMECLVKLARVMPGEYVFNWHDRPYLWLNFVVRAGGCLVDYDRGGDPVMIDCEETRRGFKLFRGIRDLLGIRLKKDEDFVPRFFEGRAAFCVQPREFLAKLLTAGMKEWRTVSLPRIPGGADLNVQATDVFCVRKGCVDLNDARQMLRLLLSREFQNYLGGIRYAIPLRKSAAAASIDYENPSDVLFMSESTRMYASYNLDSEDIYNMVHRRIQVMLNSDEDIDAATAELGDLMRAYLRVRRNIEKIA